MNLSKLLPLLLIVALLGIIAFQGYEDGNAASDGPSRSSGVPTYVMDVLQKVQTTGKAPKNFVGGRTFQNREKRLPKKGTDGQKVKYREWDVHKKVKGKNRGAERLVTGSDGSAYFTKDHYKTFKKIE